MADHKLNGEDNVEDFLGHLYTDICTEARWSVELSDINDATKEMVKRIVTEAVVPYMEELESEGVTNIDVSDAGSMAEGTNICNPDEFDFVISFTYSSDILKTFPSSNKRNISFSKYTVKPRDPRFRQIGIGINKKAFLPTYFMERNFRRLECALLKVSEEGPIRRRENCLYLDVKSDKTNAYYGMQGPAFHLHNNLRWCSPNRDKDFFISVDLVPTIVIYDENFADKLPIFIQGCSCEEHLINKPDHFFLVPVKSRDIFFGSFYHNTGDGDSDHWEAKREFMMRNFMVSLSEYESDIMKTWKCEKSIYHNWFVCYKLLKCFGNLDHNCGATIHFNPENMVLKGHTSGTLFPERNENFTSYTWKTLVCEMASQETNKLTLKQCFDRLTAMFDKENLDKSKVLTVNSFLWPSEISDTIHLVMRDSECYTPFVNQMIQLKVILNEIIDDSSYNYPHYKEKLMELFPGLSSYFTGANDSKSK